MVLNGSGDKLWRTSANENTATAKFDAEDGESPRMVMSSQTPGLKAAWACRLVGFLSAPLSQTYLLRASG